MTMMTSLQDRVVLEVFKKYEALPKKSKPGLDNNGKRQWVPLSGIVMSDGKLLSCGIVLCISR